MNHAVYSCSSPQEAPTLACSSPLTFMLHNKTQHILQILCLACLQLCSSPVSTAFPCTLQQQLLRCFQLPGGAAVPIYFLGFSPAITASQLPPTAFFIMSFLHCSFTYLIKSALLSWVFKALHKSLFTFPSNI